MGRSFRIAGQQFLLDDQPFQIRCGEMHYLRVPQPYWRDRLKKARAMGLNSVCAYVFWNAHEPRPGEFDFAGQRDVAAFVRMAQEERFWVILRPGPYCCAEWDFGGLPAWLLATPDIRVRCSDRRYTDAARRYLLRLGRELAPLTITRGGPILMVQVENEYGAFGHDKDYMRLVRDTIREAGFDDVPLFTCDWPQPDTMHAGSIEECSAVANFGSRAEQNITRFRQLRPDAPPMCGEFWSGWFDHWGGRRQGNADPTQPAADMKWMLDNGVSFSLYMFHGGTSFGFSAGANHYDDYAPTVTSYDYWAPLDEAGRPTAKFHAFRELLAGYQPPGTTVPDLPPPLPAPMQTPQIELTESAGVFDNLPEAIRSPQPQPMEALGQSYGMILYRADISGLGSGERGEATLRVIEPHDYALVYLDGRLVGTLDRRKHETTLKLTGITRGQGPCCLDILVDAMGRVNFGSNILDRKGITQHVSIDHRFVVMNWSIYPLSLDEAHLGRLRWTSAGAAGDRPAFFRGTLKLAQVADTFLDLRGFSRGMVWVNGHNLGRYWRIGPQQTLYLPGCWLREGDNQVVVLDLRPRGTRMLRGLAEPILDDTPGGEG